MNPPRRRLSSRQTFFVKYVWIGMLHVGFATLTVLALLESLPFDGETAEDGFFKVAVPFVWLVMVGGQHWTVGRLKQVEIDDERLYVSNYLVEDAIGLAEIEKVIQRRGPNVEPVYVTFSRETDFGTRILFAPPGLFNWRFWRVHPVVDELRSAAQRARMQRRN